MPGNTVAVSTVGMFGEGRTQGASVSSIHIARVQPSMGTTSSCAADAVGLVEEAGQLAGGHAVARGDREEADEGGEGGVEDVAGHRLPADRVGAVADDHALAQRARRAHAVRHGVDERVDAAADVLEVDHDDVDVLRASASVGSRVSL